jgi:siroheme synthase-like protein
MIKYYPIFINLKGKNCVVVGGGNVALRKIQMLLECGGDIRVISPDFCEEITKLAINKRIKVMPRKYKKGDLQGSFIAVIATNDQDVNRKIAEEAKREKVLLNVVDNPEISDFIVPSILTRGDLIIAVSTGGKSPALARKIRTKLEEYIGEEYTGLVQMVNEIRTEFKRNGNRLEGEDWQKAINLDELIPLLKRGEGEKAKAVLMENLMKYLNK